MGRPYFAWELKDKGEHKRNEALDCRNYAAAIEITQLPVKRPEEKKAAGAATGQSYTIGSRTLTRANLTEVRNAIEYWNGKVQKLENVQRKGGRNRIKRGVIRDVKLVEK